MLKICLCKYLKTSRKFLVTRFMEEMSYVFLFIFFHCRSFSSWWPLAFLIFPPLLQNFHVVLPTKKVFPLSFYLSLFFSSSPAGLSPTFSFSLYSKSVDMTINLSLILQTTRLQKQFPLPSLLTLQLSLFHKTRGYEISPPKEPQVVVPVC